MWRLRHLLWHLFGASHSAGQDSRQPEAALAAVSQRRRHLPHPASPLLHQAPELLKRLQQLPCPPVHTLSWLVERLDSWAPTQVGLLGLLGQAQRGASQPTPIKHMQWQPSCTLAAVEVVLTAASAQAHPSSLALSSRLTQLPGLPVPAVQMYMQVPAS